MLTGARRRLGLAVGLCACALLLLQHQLVPSSGASMRADVRIVQPAAATAAAANGAYVPTTESAAARRMEAEPSKRAARHATAAPTSAPAGGSAEPPPLEAHPRARVGGDVYDEPVLLREAAAVARSLPDGRRQLVLVPTSKSYAHLGLNLLLNLQRLGYEHVLLLGVDAGVCAEATALSPLPTSCVWDGGWQRDAERLRRARPWLGYCVPGPSGCQYGLEPQASYRQWLSRWVVNARLVAAGYDTLMLDVDTALVDDVLAVLSAPPLSRYQLLFHGESFGDPFGNVQCGLVACQGARPGGGAASVVAGFALRIFRFLDTAHERRLARPRPPVPNRTELFDARFTPAWAELMPAKFYFVFDQVHLVDVVQSQTLGVNTFRMARGYNCDVEFHSSAGPDRPGAVRERGAADGSGRGSVAVPAMQAAGANLSALPPLSARRVNELYKAFVESRGASREWRRRELIDALPRGWRERFALDRSSAAIYEADLTDGWPADTAELPLEGGAPPLAPIREGSLAHSFLRQLERDRAAGEALRAAQQHSDGAAARQPPGGGAAGAAAAGPGPRAPPSEPERVALLPTWLVSHWREGIRGGWGVDPPAAIAVHATNAVDKLLVLTANGLFDRRAYAAANDTVHADAFIHRTRPPVIGYLPALGGARSLGAAREKGGAYRPPLQFDAADEYRAAVLQGLPAAAALSGRVLAYPRVPCASAWLTHERAQGAGWAFRGCRTGLCGEWRVVVVGYASEEEAEARGAMRRGGAGTPPLPPRPQPLPADSRLQCAMHPNMMWPDSPVRHRYGSCCNGHAAFNNERFVAVGYALSAWDLEAYAAQLGPAAQPAAGRNLAFAAEAAELAAAAARGGAAPPLLQVSEARLRAELASFEAEPIVWLAWPLNVTDPAEGPGRLAHRMRTFCRRDDKSSRPSLRRPKPPRPAAGDGGAGAADADEAGDATQPPGGDDAAA